MSPASEGESGSERPPSFQVPSSFIIGPAAEAPLPDQSTIAGQPPPLALAGIPQDLKHHPRYRLVASLGVGGMGAVYRAEHRLMGRPVALKVIRGDLLGSHTLVERFRREVKSAARLAAHPNIVAAYDAEQAGETHMLVMEFVEGIDLARLVERRGPLPVAEACEYVRQATVGLQHAFEDGMIHRDIKPQNLMRTTRGQVKILDFGLARFASEVGSLAGVTAEGMILGTADYVAPEQIDDPHAADTRADIYSLGCTLYFLLAGHAPFPDRSLIQKLIAHREKIPRPLREIRADVPPELARIVELMMAKDPGERFQIPEEVARALAPFAENHPAPTPATSLDAPAIAHSPDASPALASMLVDQKTSGPATRNDPPWRRLGVQIALALAMLPVIALFLAAVVYRIQTPTGMLIIESDDPTIAVIVKQGGNQVTIVDPRTKQPIELKAGRYELELAGGDGLKLSTDTFALKRGDRTLVTVRREPPVQAQQPKPIAASQGGPSTDAISPRTQAILKTLEEPVPMDFADQTPLEDMLDHIKHATFKWNKPTDPGLPIYVDPIGLHEAGRTRTSKVQINLYGAPLRLTLSLALGQLGLAYIVKDDVLIISSPKGIERERNDTANPAADASPGTKAVLATLEGPISMSFANETPLNDVLTYIKHATFKATNPTDPGLQIFVDPGGLQQAGRTLDSTVSIDLYGVPLKTTLRLMLKQLGLAYAVKDGIVFVSSAEDIRRRSAQIGAQRQ
jgi:serine/threonine protein kinase